MKLHWFRGRASALHQVKLRLQHRSESPHSGPNDGGFTLVELLIVIIILPIIVGAISLSLVSVISLKTSVSDRLGASADAQIVAANYYGDIQSATLFTTSNSPQSGLAPCQASQLLGLQWGPASSTTVVSYAENSNGQTSSTGQPEFNLVRSQCTSTNGAAPTVTKTETVSFNVPAGLVAVPSGQSCTATTCTPISTNPQPGSTNWASATGLQNIVIVINEASSNASSTDPTCTAGVTFCYSVAATPRNWENLGSNGTNPTPSIPGLVPAEFIGGTGVDLASCTSGNPNVNINGELVIDSASDPATSGKNNVYSGTVSYVSSEGAPTNLAGSQTLNPISTPDPDPLAGLSAPDTSGLPTNPAKVKIGTITYAYPGIYTSALTGPLTLLSGTYVLENGISGNITSGVGGDFLYVTGGTVSPSGFSIWPLTSGQYDGLALWQVSGDSNDITASGNGVAQIGGIVYAPTAAFAWKGTESDWVGALLTASLNCTGGGNGEMNIGYYQTITFTSQVPANPTVGSHYTVSAAGGGSGNPVAFSIDNLSTAGACTISGSVVTLTAAGTCLVDANQARSVQSGAQGGYLEAPTVQQSI